MIQERLAVLERINDTVDSHHYGAASLGKAKEYSQS